MPDIEIKITDNSQAVRQELNEAVERALTRIGMQAETFAKKIITSYPAVDTGNLRNSISNKVKTEGENAVYIGTNVEYAPYVELGARGRKGVHFLRDAAADHTDVYKRIIKDDYNRDNKQCQ